MMWRSRRVISFIHVFVVLPLCTPPYLNMKGEFSSSRPRFKISDHLTPEQLRTCLSISFSRLRSQISDGLMVFFLYVPSIHHILLTKVVRNELHFLFLDRILQEIVSLVGALIMK